MLCSVLVLQFLIQPRANCVRFYLNPFCCEVKTLYTKLGIQEVAVALRTKCLRWNGHVARASSWTNSITIIATPGPRGHGRPVMLTFCLLLLPLWESVIALLFCFPLLYVHSSIAIILMGKRELVALLNLSSWCLVMVEWLFLMVPWGCLRFVIVVFPDHTHLLFWSECVKADVEVCNLEGIDPQNREAWISGVRRTSQLQLTPGTGKLSAVLISNQD